jgi:hypothetical protein
MSTRTKWAVIWAGWCGYFAAAEYIAVRSQHPDAPLCAHLRTVLGTRSHRTHKLTGALSLAAFLTWFVPHLYRED